MKWRPVWLTDNIIGFSLASFFSDLGHEMATAVLPGFLINLVGPSAAPQALGLITGVSDALASIIKPFSGMMSDRLPRRKPLIIVGYVCTAIFVGLIGFVHSVALILLYRTLAWIGRGLREPARDAFIAESIDQRYYGRAFGFQRAMDTAGAVLGPLVVFFIITKVSLPTIFALTFIPGFAAVVAIAYFTREEQHVPIQRIPGFAGWLAQIKQLPPSFKYFLLIMFVFGCGNFNKTMLILYAQKYGATLLSFSGASIGVLLYTIFNISRALGEYFLGALSDAIGRRLPLGLFGFGFFGIISLAMIMQIASWWLLMILFILNGISTAAVTSIEKAFAADLLPSHLRGTGFGLLQMVDGIGDFVASFVVGTLWSILASWVGFLYAAVLSFIAVGMLLSMKRL